MNKHTPGPWKIKKKFCAYRFFALHNYLIPVEHPNGGYIAYASANKFDANSRANARLIAAAPDMLKALERVYEYNKHFVCAEGLESELLEVIEKAIRKAKGEGDQ